MGVFQVLNGTKLRKTSQIQKELFKFYNNNIHSGSSCSRTIVLPVLLLTSKRYLSHERHTLRENKSQFFSSFTIPLIFEEKYFSCYILLIDQISLSGCLYFVRYWSICQYLIKLLANHSNQAFFLHEQKVKT